ncbi:protein obstructor-E-like isoform X1 [Cylas formicarius]|uniref:protein obstructor-E-like isoform X1 n=1 Tax=Cylas formicarius TaxID=197179 RepID=UPI002958827D|nr:protein obstructor-E-like isoform X1 [Cylas formicarius]
MENLGRTCFVVICAVIGVSGQFKCPQRTGYFPHPVQCDLYYQCSKGEHEVKLCPDGLVFDDSDPNHERCDIPANVDCADRTALQPPKPSKGCPRANGYYRHDDPRACDKFFNCVDGVAHELPCPPGLVYDDVASTCAWPETSKRKCENSKRDALDDGFSCPEGDIQGPDGRKLPHPTFAHPDDCQKFYICRNGVQPQKGSCANGTVYNEDTFTCEDPANVPGCENYFGQKKN